MDQDDVDINRIIQDVTNIVPSEDANCYVSSGIKRMLENLPSLIINGSKLKDYHEECKTVDSLISILNENSRAVEESLEKAFQYQEKYCPKWLKELFRKCGCVDNVEILEKMKKESSEKLRQQYIETIQKVQQEMADKLLQSCTLAAAVVVISDSIRLFIIWSHIKDAENCILENRDKCQIQLNLTDIEAKLIQMEEIVSELKVNTDRKVFHNIIDQMEDLVIETRDLVTGTANLIAKVKADIHGKKEMLLADDQNLTVSISMNVVQLAVNGFQFVTGSGAATFFWKMAASVAIAAQIGVAGTSVYTKKVTHDTIVKCRAAYKELNQLDVQLVQYRTKVDVIRRWVRKSQRQFDIRNDELVGEL